MDVQLVHVDVRSSLGLLSVCSLDDDVDEGDDDDEKEDDDDDQGDDDDGADDDSDGTR